MKYIDTFSDFLSEKFDYGEKLFADPLSLSNWRWTDFLNRVYSEKWEINTDDEKILLGKLHSYFDTPQKSNLTDKDLKELFPLKKKFPDILDPSNHVPEIRNNGPIPIHPDFHMTLKTNGIDWERYAWRGSTVPKNMTLDKDNRFLYVYSSSAIYKFFVNEGVKYSPKRGYSSFSTNPTQAFLFANSNKKLTSNRNQIQVMYGIDKKHPNFIISPNASNTISEHWEDETFFVGNSVKTDITLFFERMF